MASSKFSVLGSRVRANRESISVLETKTASADATLTAAVAAAEAKMEVITRHSFSQAVTAWTWQKIGTVPSAKGLYHITIRAGSTEEALSSSIKCSVSVSSTGAAMTVLSATSDRSAGGAFLGFTPVGGIISIQHNANATIYYFVEVVGTPDSGAFVPTTGALGTTPSYMVDLGGIMMMDRPACLLALAPAATAGTEITDGAASYVETLTGVTLHIEGTMTAPAGVGVDDPLGAAVGKVVYPKLNIHESNNASGNLGSTDYSRILLHWTDNGTDVYEFVKVRLLASALTANETQLEIAVPSMMVAAEDTFVLDNTVHLVKLPTLWH